MKNSLTEAITRKLVERNEPYVIVCEVLEDKLLDLIPHLRDMSCINIRNIYKDIPEFEVHSLDGVEIVVRDTEHKVVISIEEINKALQSSSVDSSNPLSPEEAVEAMHIAFHWLPHRCPYFKHGKDCLIFRTMI